MNFDLDIPPGSLAAGEKSILYLTIYGESEETDMALSWYGLPVRRAKERKRFD